MSKDTFTYITEDYTPTPGRTYRDHELDLERIKYRLARLGSNIQDISQQIQELKELIQAKKNGE